MTESVFAQHGDRPKPNSETILYYVQKNPGSHLRGISKGLGIPLGTLRYHLTSLEKADKIMSERYGSHRHYFIPGFFKENERNLLKMLNKKTLRVIISYMIRQDSPVTLPDIASYTGISHSSAVWYVKGLANLGMAIESNGGKYKRYQLVKSTEIINLLKIYVSVN